MKKNFLLFCLLTFAVVMAIPGCKREHLQQQHDAPDNGSVAAFKKDDGEWSVPVHLGPEVNSSSRELGATLSSDGLSLYFNSDRPGGYGLFDIYVSHRACADCPWEMAQNIGPVINGPDNGGAPAMSHDGHLLFFGSDRGGLSEDLWVSHRQNQNDDFGWEAPVNMGPLVNSADNETSPSFVGGGEHAELYFLRGGMTWVAPVTQHGVIVGPPVQVDLGGSAQSASVRKDGREMVFWASPARGGLGDNDIWVSTRSHIGDAWSTPVNLGAPVNTAGGELEAAISDDGKTLVFSGTMTRGSSLGRQDIWISTRTH